MIDIKKVVACPHLCLKEGVACPDMDIWFHFSWHRVDRGHARSLELSKIFTLSACYLLPSSTSAYIKMSYYSQVLSNTIGDCIL